MYLYKVSGISYLNTLPFLYGLENHKIHDRIELSLDNPSVCAEKLVSNKTDIGLIPVAAIPQMNQSRIISDYCIGAVGPVKSVILFSNVPINQIKTIWLDYQSRTSVVLIKILAQKFWKIKVNWKNAKPGYEKSLLSNKDGGIIIGDRAFPIMKMYPYIYDLAGEWQKYTNLPFVFAAWVANKNIEKDFLLEFNQAMRYGINHLEETVNSFSKTSVLSKTDMLNYLQNNISYSLDQQKQKGLKRFFDELNTLKS
ncbi:MAG: menaquinone biosynthesis protein [Bacteroidales bacterium]|nr:menaquinone biosynthesis protein [Bacteroidales bacterium]